MATVLSRALKLPGKLQPRDYLAPAGLEEVRTPGSRGPSLSGVWPQPERSCRRAEARRCSPRGLGVTRHQGQKRRAASGVVGAGANLGNAGKDPEGARWWPGAAAAAADVRARVLAVPRGAMRLASSFPERREGPTGGLNSSVLGWTGGRARGRQDGE